MRSWSSPSSCRDLRSYGQIVLRLVKWAVRFEIELTSRTGGHATKHSRVGGKREWHTGQFVYPHPSGHGYRRHLGNLDRPLANNVAAQDLVRRAVGDQFAKAEGASVDDRARRRVEVSNRGDDIVCFTCLRFGEAHLGILGVREAADRTHLVFKR